MTDNFDSVAEKWLDWVESRVVEQGRGDGETTLGVAPEGKFWLGRLAPEDQVAENANAALERMAPCAMGFRCFPAGPGPWSFDVEVVLAAWKRLEASKWVKCGPVKVVVPIRIEGNEGNRTFGTAEIRQALAGVVGVPCHAAELRLETRRTPSGNELTIQLVNVTPEEAPQIHDGNLYQCSMCVKGLTTLPFRLAALPESFRYDRSLPAWGINCGTEADSEGNLKTVDTPNAHKRRPKFWRSELPDPDLRFSTLSNDPLPSCESLSSTFTSWGRKAWSKEHLLERARSESWTREMIEEAESEALIHEAEVARLAAGVDLLRGNATALRAFRLMNAAMELASEGKYDRWRPFQIGFLLSNLEAVVDPDQHSDIVDIVWFATGGGKTETYLGLLVTAAFHDRLTGKMTGVTAWTRFPLRMLSLQQTQRFADALGAAETIRFREGIPGDSFSLGFYVGSGAPPNSIPVKSEDGKPDPDDPNMPARFRILTRCPFCRSEDLRMHFDRRLWKLEHRCASSKCTNPNPNRIISFHLVDDEIYRFLPTVVVGTLDKAALIAQQQAARGLVGPPNALCSEPGHGFTYAKRSNRPQGCFVPGCDRPTVPLPQPRERFAPSFRLQDELHLLRDSLGAVDAHYEALLDHLQFETTRKRSKIIASSATLSGYVKQSEVLYRRQARVFPQPPPSEGQGFWTSDGDSVMRRYVALAPRGATIEFVVDRTFEIQQRLIRELVADVEGVCERIGLPSSFGKELIDRYGTAVAYGNTIRDLDAVVRSWETQIVVEGELNAASLTGKTDFEDVRNVLRRLENPEPDFQHRLHLVSASAMMSHGVDVDRLNTMVMIGLPLGAAEFLQASARVGRRWPGIVFVVHKINREREAGIYRSFEKFVLQGDRFVEPIPITRRSRRVLERTLPGLAHARLLHIHEPHSKKPLTTAASFREYAKSDMYRTEDEVEALIRALELRGPLDEAMRKDIEDWFELFLENTRSMTHVKWISDLMPRPFMRSLRDVEEQAPIKGSRTPRK